MGASLPTRAAVLTVWLVVEGLMTEVVEAEVAMGSVAPEMAATCRARGSS